MPDRPIILLDVSVLLWLTAYREQELCRAVAVDGIVRNETVASFFMIARIITLESG